MDYCSKNIAHWLVCRGAMWKDEETKWRGWTLPRAGLLDEDLSAVDDVEAGGDLVGMRYGSALKVEELRIENG